MPNRLSCQDGGERGRALLSSESRRTERPVVRFKSLPARRDRFSIVHSTFYRLLLHEIESLDIPAART